MPETDTWLVHTQGTIIDDTPPVKPTQVEQYHIYLNTLAEKRTLLISLKDHKTMKIIKPADDSRYFPQGRKRIKAKIHKRLGRWFNCPGILWGMTYDPKRISKEEAWKNVGKHRRQFLHDLNTWRQRHGKTKLKCLSVIEVQKNTGYPHIHIVFPNLRYLGRFDHLQDLWAHGMCWLTAKDCLSPVTYICKYITKLEGWDDESLAQIWLNRTRLYSMSRDYTMPDYSDKRPAEWAFVSQHTVTELNWLIAAYPALYKDWQAIPPPLVRSLN